MAYVAGLLLMAVATTPAEAMLGIGVLTGIAMGGCSTSIILTVLSRAVPDVRKRAIYTGIATAGGFSGQIVFLPATQSVRMATDWTVTLMILGAVAALIIPLAAALVSPVAERTPIDQPQTINAALGEAFRHRGYVLLSIGYFVCGFQTLFIATRTTAYSPRNRKTRSYTRDIGWRRGPVSLFSEIGPSLASRIVSR